MPITEFYAKSINKLVVPSSGQIDYMDASLPGFGLRVSAGGTRTWTVFYRYNSTKRRLKLGNFPLVGLSEARDLAREALREASKGHDPAADKIERRRIDTVEELGNLYLENYAKLRKRSWIHDQRILRHDVVPALGRRRADDVSRADVRTLVASIAERAPIRANRTLEIIRKMYNWAISEEIIQQNPCDHLKPPSLETKRKRFLQDNELGSFWAAVTAMGGMAEVAFKLLLITGQREMEVGKMMWRDVDLETGTWLIPSGTTKNGRDQLVPLPPHAVTLLERLWSQRGHDTEWVFQSPVKRGHVVRNYWEKRIIALRKATSLVDIRIHDLRRTAATNWAKLKAGRFIVKRLLNHVDRDVTDVYDVYEYIDEKRGVLVAWEQKLLGLAA